MPRTRSSTGSPGPSDGVHESAMSAGATGASDLSPPTSPWRKAASLAGSRKSASPAMSPSSPRSTATAAASGAAAASGSTGATGGARARHHADTVILPPKRLAKAPKPLGTLQSYHLWYEGQSVMSMLETWEKVMVYIVLALFGTLWYLAVVNYFPAHLRLVSQRMSFYLFGDASPSDAIPSKFST